MWREMIVLYFLVGALSSLIGDKTVCTSFQHEEILESLKRIEMQVRSLEKIVSSK